MRLLAHLLILILLTSHTNFCYSLFQYSAPILKENLNNVGTKSEKNILNNNNRINYTNKQKKKIIKLLNQYLYLKYNNHIVGKRSIRHQRNALF